MNAEQLSKKFLDFFGKRGHAIQPSSSLVHRDDPSVLFTTAGMQQFKPYFLGDKDPKKDFGTSRVATVQRCLRTSDAVDETHLTFFEMLGNFSFADYFKQEAIGWAWEFLTRQARIDRSRLWVTVFGGDGEIPADAEAQALWQGMVELRHPVSLHGRSANFWGPTGETGPCGPSSEIHYDLRKKPCERGDQCLPNCPCGRFVELWNLVFTEYEKKPDGSFVALKNKHIDTGMGLERLAFLVERKQSLFETDLFLPIIRLLRISPAFGTLESAEENCRRERIVADHLRACVALIADGVEMSNKDQGYVLRRLTREFFDQFERLAFDLAPFVDTTGEILGMRYPSFPRLRDHAIAVLERERATYGRVLRLDVDAIVRKLQRKVPAKGDEAHPSERLLSADEAFQLSATYGLSAERLRRSGFTFDREAFEEKVAEHQRISRAGATKKFGGHGFGGHGVAPIPVERQEDLPSIRRLHTATHLLQQALREIVGSHTQQMGSDITPERLRFDFTHAGKLTPGELQRIEDLVNAKIAEDLPTSVREMSYQEARDLGALAFFKERYPERVTVYSFGDWSREICGGPHVAHTAEVGKFHILSEKSSAAGIRRIKAVVEG